MKDRKGITLIPGCILQSDLGGKESTRITYAGDGVFDCPGGGTINHTQESLLDSRWRAIHYQKKKEQ